MPERAWEPPPVDDAIAELTALAAQMTHAELEAFMFGRDRVSRGIVERAIAEQFGTGWRRNPATMAHHLTGGHYKLWPYTVLLAEQWAKAFRGEDPRQLWNIGSQYGKTTGIKWGIVWALDMRPTLRLMYVSYDANKAVEEAGGVRDLARRYADELRFVLRPDKQARGQWSTTEGGGLYATGVNGGIVGWPADGVIGDDLLKGWEAAHSAAQREKVMAVYRSQMRLRVQAYTDPIIIANTRWHEDDPTARLLLDSKDPEGDQWTHISLPTIAGEADILGRQPGEVLCEERFPRREVLARRATLGPYLFQALEQQDPHPVEGGEIKRAWFQFTDHLPDEADRWITSIDTKLKEKTSGDCTVVQTWAKVGGNFYCCDQVKGQWTIRTTKTAIALMQVRWPKVGTHIIEKAGYGPEVMEQLTEADDEFTVTDEAAGELGMTDDERVAVETLVRSGVSGILGITPKGDKLSRARAVVGYIEAGNVYLPVGQLWTAHLLDEAAAFPPQNNGNDDQVDAMTQALKFLSSGGQASTAPARARSLPTNRVARRPIAAVRRR